MAEILSSDEPGHHQCVPPEPVPRVVFWNPHNAFEILNLVELEKGIVRAGGFPTPTGLNNILGIWQCLSVLG